MENKIRKVFSVVVGKKPYDVFDIEGKEHSGYMEVPNTWWLYFADNLPEGLFPPIDSDSLVPFSRSIERLCYELRFKVVNTSKYKWDEWRFSHHTVAEIWCNGKQVHEIVVMDLAFAMAKAYTMLILMSEHPYSFFDTEKEIGRKIYFFGLPATIRPHTNSYSWEISIVPEYTDEYPKYIWWKEYRRRQPTDDTQFKEMDLESDSEDMNRDEINWGDALEDGHINWFRK